MGNDVYQRSLAAHRQARGKIATTLKMRLNSEEDLALAYTPGVAEPCRTIAADPAEVYELTSKWNTVAVVTDGSAVLGLGDIGPAASLPVMEGKSALFKRFADIDSFPLALATRNIDEIVRTVSVITSSLGGINLEDIASPRCLEIERRLQDVCDIPVFHDDQHGTAVISAAGLFNALKLAGKELAKVKIVVGGAGAAGGAAIRFLMSFGAADIVACDRRGAIYQGRPGMTNWASEELAQITNQEREKGDLGQVIRGADVFIGLSAPGTLTGEMVAAMAPRAIVLAMANPTPEIFPDEAKAAGALVVATGRSDFPNQLNNCLGFPGIFRGALDTRAYRINEEMKKAAALALSGLAAEKELNPDYIIPSIFDPRVAPTIAAAVAEAARATGVARR
ncbi:MAG: NAD-dependent malic enzyme [Candidatus Adiutrix sp.]|jgi:malate dehydrogenase (oxaloacetate-decarboxylating)|nr:NAD-dependent malic enzyme [Candidatus Adiutrix sp.]